jgi:Na+-driven multidrug efflux pump
MIGAGIGTIVGLAVGMFLAFLWLLHYNKRLGQIDQFNHEIRFDDLKDDNGPATSNRDSH